MRSIFQLSFLSTAVKGADVERSVFGRVSVIVSVTSFPENRNTLLFGFGDLILPENSTAQKIIAPLWEVKSRYGEIWTESVVSENKWVHEEKT